MKHDVEGNMFRFTWLIIGLLVIPADAAEWPQWRGPLGQGHAPTAKDLPNQWKVGSQGKEVSGVEYSMANRDTGPGMVVCNDRWRNALAYNSY